jgi:putative hemolysin
MTPRPELISMDSRVSVDELYAKFIETGLSKILIFEKTPDHIIGYVHQKDLFKKPTHIKSILIPIEITTETMSAMEMLNKFSKSRKSIALVVDELGVTAGIITIEDIMEEVFGEIEDEHDVEDLIEQQLSADEFRFSARHEISYLNDTYKLGIPEGEYHTLGGFIFAYYQSFPPAGEQINILNFDIFIESVNNSRINLVKLTKLDKTQE